MRSNIHRRLALLVVPSLGGLVLAAACGLPATGSGTNVPADEAGTSSRDGGPEGLTDGGVVFLDGALPSDAALLPDGAPDPYGMRVTKDMVALYELEENAGSTVNDSMPLPYPLNVATLASVAWHPHYIEIKDFTRIASGANFDKLLAACKPTNEVTVEAWVRYVAIDTSGSNYGRLLSLGSGDTTRDLAMGSIDMKQWWFSMANADDAIADGLSSVLAHTVLVRTNDSKNTVHGFVNGVEVASKESTLEPKNMKPYVLTLGNTAFGDRGVKADVHLVAFYSRALTVGEIMQNFQAGPDPGGP
jgi:hypothetical protein